MTNPAIEAVRRKLAERYPASLDLGILNNDADEIIAAVFDNLPRAEMIKTLRDEMWGPEYKETYVYPETIAEIDKSADEMVTKIISAARATLLPGDANVGS